MVKLRSRPKHPRIRHLIFPTLVHYPPQVAQNDHIELVDVCKFIGVPILFGHVAAEIIFGTHFRHVGAYKKRICVGAVSPLQTHT
jgi:hypothetical protein